MRNLTTFGSALALSLCGVLAFGCDDDDAVLFDDGVGFSDVDINDDGVIEETEYAGAFDDWDTDDDGYIDRDEYDLALPFATIDANGDGLVSQEEYGAAFGALDINANSVLDEEELLD